LVGPRTTLTMGPDGSIRSCSLSTRTVGNILTDAWDLLEQRLWQLELGPMRAAIPARCRMCEYWPRCLGGCRLSAYTVFGCLDRPDPLAPEQRR
jgi:radical SAM protein with 4Fe4S-binding SPASM domain